MTVELENIATDPETALITHLAPLYPHTDSSPQKVSNERRSGDPLPFILVHELPGDENIEESYLEALVSIHVLTHKAAGRNASRDETDKVRGRMVWIARTLPTVTLSGGRYAEFDYVDVVNSFHTEEYGDDQILRKVARYKLGMHYD